MRKLLNDVGSNYFSVLASHPGFLRYVVMTLHEFKHAGISPSGLRAFLDRAHPAGVYQQRIESLQKIYASYTQFLAEQHLYDDTDVLACAILMLEKQYDTDPLLLYGFTDFTPLQQQVVNAAVKTRDTLVFFPWREGTAYEAATAALGWFTSHGFQRTTLSVERGTQTSLQRLQTQIFESVLFVADEERRPPDHSVLLLSAPTVSREVREIARTIFTLVRERHFHFDDIAILLPSLPLHGPIFHESLTLLGVPCSLSHGISLLQTRAGQSVMLLWQVLAEDYARTRVLEFLNVARPPFGEILEVAAETAQLALWDTLSLEAGVVRGAEEWRRRLAQLLARNESDAREMPSRQEHADQPVLRACIEFMETFLTDSERIPRSNSWNDWGMEMQALVSRYVSPSTYTEQVTAVLGRLGQLNMLGEVVSLREWGRVVADALATTLAQPAEEDPAGRVFVGDVASACGMQFRAVIIPGLVEGQFPQTVRQDPLLFDSERQYLSEVLLCDLRQRNHIVEEERLAFALALQSATECVVLTYARQDQASGRIQIPSSYLLRAVETLSGHLASLAELKDWCVHIPLAPLWNDRPATALDSIEFHWASVARARETSNPSVLGYLPEATPFFSSALNAVHQRWDRPLLTAYDGVLMEESTKTVLNSHLFPTQVSLSASALETFARCPFRYFLTAVLGLAPQDDPEQLMTIRPRERGTLLHVILHDFFSRLRRAQQLPIRDQALEPLRQLLREVADSHCAAFAQAKVTGLPLLWELEQERIRTQLLLLLQEEYERTDAFVPAGIEVVFGRQEEAGGEAAFFPDRLVPFPTNKAPSIFLHGRIDRVDVSSDGRQGRVLDYKSGKPIKGKFAGGTALQLPLYLFAARLLRPEVQWVGAEYVTLGHSARKDKAPTFLPDTWEEELEVLKMLVGTITEGIRAGCFPPTPDSCRPCPFPLICGAQAELRAARKQGDTRLAFLQQLRNTL